MAVLLVGALWVVSLGVAVYAAERLVQTLASLGRHLGLAAGVVGLLVALGADGPEVTSAIIALARGSEDIGLGVVIGSNIYNLAGLLGFAAVLAAGISTDRYRLILDGGANLLVTLLLWLLVEESGLHVPLGILLLLALALYVVLLAIPRPHVLRLLGLSVSLPPDEPGEAIAPVRSVPRSVIVSMVSVVAIVAGSDVLVNASIYLGPKLSIPNSILGTFILPIATSLPNTWAAVSLATKGLARAAIAATLNSNTINAAIGTGLPALFLSLHASTATRTLDIGWLLGMTVVAIILLETRELLARWEGVLLLALYAAFVAVRVTVF